MKNILILLSLFTFSTVTARQCEKHVYKNIPATFVAGDDVWLEMILLFSSLTAKYEVYNIEQIKCKNGSKFIVYNDNCYFSIQLNKKRNKCKIRFCASNSTFSYISFKNTMDYFFVPTECAV